jgi:hypothetical protein
MTSHQDPGTGLAPGLGQPQRVRFLTLRVNPLRAAQTQGPHSGLHPSTPSDQQEPRTVSPVNPTHHNPLPNPQTTSPTTATTPNPPAPCTQETQHDSIADPSTDTITAPPTGRPHKPYSPPPQPPPAAYHHSPSQSWAADRVARSTATTAPASSIAHCDAVNELPIDDRAALSHALTVLSAFGDDDRLWTEEILTRLATFDPATYTAWDAECLAVMLRRFGVIPGQIWRHGRNRRGYLGTDITRALGEQHSRERPLSYPHRSAQPARPPLDDHARLAASSTLPSNSHAPSNQDSNRLAPPPDASYPNPANIPAQRTHDHDSHTPLEPAYGTPTAQAIPRPRPVPDALTTHIQHLVAQAPPLTGTQRAELRAILRPANQPKSVPSAG